VSVFVFRCMQSGKLDLEFRLAVIKTKQSKHWALVGSSGNGWRVCVCVCVCVFVDGGLQTGMKIAHRQPTHVC